MSRTEQGIHNFYSPWDVPFLMVLSTAAGNTDGRHALPAGAVGFHVPKTLDASQRQAYQERLPQQRYELAMLRDGHTGGHVGWTVPTFVARQVAPLIGPSAEAQNDWHTTQPDLAPIHHATASSTSRTISRPGTKRRQPDTEHTDDDEHRGQRKLRPAAAGPETRDRADGPDHKDQHPAARRGGQEQRNTGDLLFAVC
jgi:hypothetical protein